MGSTFLPHYRRPPAAYASQQARLRLRTAAYAFGDVSRSVNGLMWGAAQCPACSEGHGDADRPHPTLDAWHRVAECPTLDAARAAALADAGDRAIKSPSRDLVERAHVFREIANAVHSSWGRAFVFLATMGALLPHGTTAGLPPKWAECLTAPLTGRDAPRNTVNMALTVTLPAFGALARAAASPLPAPALPLAAAPAAPWSWPQPQLFQPAAAIPGERVHPPDEAAEPMMSDTRRMNEMLACMYARLGSR
jgi:hypothetical protein